MKMKTSELTGPALDWAVAKCEGKCEGDFAWYYDRRHTFNYSTDWAQGGPIIEQELIELSIDGASNDGMWVAKSPDWYTPASGPTLLVAAMRCFVASKLGDTVEVPEAL